MVEWIALGVSAAAGALAAGALRTLRRLPFHQAHGWLAYRPGLRVRVVQMRGLHAPRPLPLLVGFSASKEYEVLGIWSASETAEAYALLANDRDELWFIPTRHLRVARRSP